VKDHEGLRKILEQYCNLVTVFSESNANSLFSHCKQNHPIDLMKKKISSFKSIYNLSEKKLAELWRCLNKNLKKDFIHLSCVFTETPVLFALKLNDKLQLCVDYHRLNTVTVKNHYSLFFIDEITNCLNEAKIFTKIIIKNIYYWICIHKIDKWKTVF